MSQHCSQYIVLAVMIFVNCVSQESGFQLASAGNSKFAVSCTVDSHCHVVVNNDTWLASAAPWWHAENKTYCTNDSSLKIVHTELDTGQDGVGHWQGVTFTYQAMVDATTPGPIFLGDVRLYDDVNLVVFKQHYMQDTYGTNTGDIGRVVSGFPVFSVPHGTDAASLNLGYYAPRGYMAGDDAKVFGRWDATHMDLRDGYKLGPVALFNGLGDTIIMSPFDSFMAASVWHDTSTDTVSYGPIGRAQMVPEGFTVATALYYSPEGVNKAFLQWGEVMKTAFDADNAKYAEGDMTQNYLGYLTDNGAYYYYNTEKGKNYEDTIHEIELYAQEEHIPYSYMQYDSWFYPKHPDTSSGGLMMWEPDPKYLPSGMPYLQNKSSLPAAVHCKWWSPKTPMAKQNGGPYEFHIENAMALPLEQTFWDRLLAIARRWNVALFEQDWLAQMSDGLHILQTNVTIGRMWLLQMAEGVKRNGLVMQQATSYPRHVFSGLEMPVVTQQRVTMDFALRKDQWKVGVTSLWVHALGQTPFKDVFWTVGDQHCPKYPGKVDNNTEIQSLVASLTAGPIAPGDGIGKTNRDLLMRCCNAHGLILKPDRPATAIDDQFYEAALAKGTGARGEVWTTHSVISGYFFGIIFAADLKGSYNITPAKAGFEPHFPESVSFKRGELKNQSVFNEQHPLVLTACTSQDFCLYYTSPVLSSRGKKIILLGEAITWIPFSRQRIRAISLSTDDVTIELVGAPGESVTFQAAIGGAVVVFRCELPQSGSAMLSLFHGC